MKKLLFFVAAAVLVSTSLAAQSFTFNPASCDPNFGAPGDTPQFFGQIQLNGQDVADGTNVGVFNAGGQLLGVGATYTQTSSTGPDYSAVLIDVQNDDNMGACPAFTAGDMVTIRLQQGGVSLLAGNSTFSGTTTVLSNGLEFLDGPDNTSGNLDVFNFSATVFPVTLEAFTATATGGTVELAWTTSEETDNDYFEVQRADRPTGPFIGIGKVRGNETTGAYNTYAFTDVRPVSGANYYRLLQVDFDGTSDLSGIVVAETTVAAERGVAAYPNPAGAGDRLTVRLSGQWGSGTQIQLLDANGRRVAEWTDLAGGSLNTTLPVVRAGVYQLVATDANDRRVTRVVIR